MVNVADAIVRRYCFAQSYQGDMTRFTLYSISTLLITYPVPYGAG